MFYLVSYGDPIVNGGDQYQILVSRFDLSALAPYVGTWYNGSLGGDHLVINADGSGKEGLVCEGTFNPNYPTALVCWNATLQFTVTGGGRTRIPVKIYHNVVKPRYRLVSAGVMRSRVERK